MQTAPRLLDPNRPKAAPLEFAGKWVARDSKRTEILASGDDFATVCNQAKAKMVARNH